MKPTKRVKKVHKRKLFRPVFEPRYVEVILDRGVEEMKGHYMKLMVKDIRYSANAMQIIVVNPTPPRKE